MTTKSAADRLIPTQPTSGSVREPASFRDPIGFVYRRDGVLYRQISARHAADWQAFVGSGLFGQLVERGWLIEHDEAPRELAHDEDAWRVLRPRPLGFISYPYEWAFSQLKDAALLTLDVQSAALEAGMSLRDASAYNVQFDFSRPVMIDALSFEKRREGEPWVAYRQFCQHFLAPLALMALTDVVTAGLAIYDTMQYLRAPVSTICIGMAASMATVLLAAGAKGKRYALPHSRIMIHQGSGGFRGNTPDVIIQVKELESLIKINHEILARHTGQPYDKIDRDTQRDYFMSPEEASAYGIIDEVYTTPDQSLISEARAKGALGGEGAAASAGEDVKPAKKE
jgi:hypothetical protein